MRRRKGEKGKKGENVVCFTSVVGVLWTCCGRALRRKLSRVCCAVVCCHVCCSVCVVVCKSTMYTYGLFSSSPSSPFPSFPLSSPSSPSTTGQRGTRSGPKS